MYGRGEPYLGRKLYYKSSYNNWATTSDCQIAVTGFQAYTSQMITINASTQ